MTSLAIPTRGDIVYPETTGPGRLSIGELGMFTTKLNLVTPLAVLVVVAASIESALAGPGSVPAPVIAAGLPALAILAGGYWLIRKVRQRR